MKRLLTSLKFTILSVIFLAGFVINTFTFHSAPAAAILLIFFLCLVVPTIGRAAAPREARSVQALYGLFVLFSAIAISGSIIYYTASFTAPVAITMVLLFPPLAWLIWQRLPVSEDVLARGHNPLSGPSIQLTKSVMTTIVAAVLLLTVVFLLVTQTATENAIRSPWDVVTPAVFIIFALAMLLLVPLLLQGQRRTLTVPLVSAALFLFLTVALLVFPLGYGFDSFIHRATENHIAQFGTIDPKPFYYIGQYSLVLFFHFAFQLPIEWLDKILVPLLAALLLPLAWLTAAAHLLKDKKNATATLTIIFLLPLSSFIVTTPQGLGNLWFLLLLLLAIPKKLDHDNQPLWPLVLGAVATMLIHPITGIPAVLFLALFASGVESQKQKYPRFAAFLSWIIFVFGCLTLPILFIVNNLCSGLGLGLNLSALSPITLIHNLHLDLFLENRFSPILDFVYLFGWNQILLLIIGAIIGLVWTLYDHKRANGHSPLRSIRIYIAMAIILFINFIVINSAINFDFLIDYERGNYAARLIPLAIFCLSPLLIIFAGRIFYSINTKPLIFKISVIAFLTVLITAAFYFNYPRHDAYESSHGYNLSAADIAAVIDVERDAAGTDYIVLANQMSSAAAIQEFGFKKYYGDQFYYPIPTGGALYQLFLKMNEHPTQETALAAMDLIGVDRVYYLVSDYWWQSEKLIETAKTNANDWWAVNNNAITIFEYDR